MALRAEAIEKVHRRLGAVSIVLRPDPTSVELRRLFAAIRSNRTVAAKILAGLLPTRGRLRAAKARLERQVEEAHAASRDARNCFLGCRTETDKTARLRVMHAELHDALAEVEADLALVAEAVEHARLVLQEQQAAFEEASRQLASIDMEWRVERGAP